MDNIPGLDRPDLSQVKRILAIQPHYDDNDISAGGTLLALAKRGVEIHYLTVTDDLVGVINTNWSAKEALKHLRENQEAAGEIMGVNAQYRLGLPDAGSYDYFSLRRQIIKHIRLVKPDALFTVDPWTPYEAHHDHVITGRAAAEAAILYQMPRMLSGATIDEALRDYQLQAVVFYNTAYANQIFNISDVLEEKHRLLRCYTAQFTPEGLDALVEQTTFLAAYVAGQEDFIHGEGLKIVAPWMLHGVPMTMLL